MVSASVSVSASDECCFPAPDCDPCADWLTFFCDYVPVTLDSCGVQTEFASARGRGVKIQAADPRAGVHPMDRVFEISMSEHDVDVSIGATVTDEDGTIWTVYAHEDITTFCLKRLFVRSVAACFGLMGDIDILEEDCRCDDDCGTKMKYKRTARAKGNILAMSGVSTDRNDSKDLTYRYVCDLERWPLDDLPKARNRLKHKGKFYRITRVDERGILFPFHLELEVDSAACC